MSAADTLTVEERLDRVRAIMIAMQAMAGDDTCPDLATSCVVLEMMAAEELKKVRAVLDAKALNQPC